MRHAHAEPGADDRARGLTAHGEQAAAEAGRSLVRVVQPDHALCSAAVRARETWSQVRDALGRVEVRIEEGLYLAERGVLLEFVRRCPAEAACLLIIAHNPGLSDLIRGIGEGNPGMSRPLRPADVVVLRMDADGWEDASRARFFAVTRIP